MRILDEPDVIRKKFKSAVTDSGSEVRRGDDKPGVTNLIDILASLTGESPDAIEARYEGSGYGQFKTDVGEAVVEAVDADPGALPRAASGPGELQRLLARGAEKARKASEPTLEAMFDRMGFVKSEAGRFFGAARPRNLVSSRHSPGREAVDAETRVDAAVQPPTRWPTASHMRRTWRLRPSCRTSSKRAGAEPPDARG